MLSCIFISRTANAFGNLAIYPCIKEVAHDLYNNIRSQLTSTRLRHLNQKHVEADPLPRTKPLPHL